MLIIKWKKDLNRVAFKLIKTYSQLRHKTAQQYKYALSKPLWLV